MDGADVTHQAGVTHPDGRAKRPIRWLYTGLAGLLDPLGTPSVWCTASELGDSIEFIEGGDTGLWAGTSGSLTLCYPPEALLSTGLCWACGELLN